MGGILSSPKVERVRDTSETDRLAEEEKQKALDRQRRGLESNIKTSYQGMLDTKDMNFTRKNCLENKNG